MWLYQSICQAQNNSQSTVIHCTPARMATGLIKNFTEYTSRQTFELNQPMIVLGEFTTVYSKLFNSQKKTLAKQNLIWPSHCLASIRKIFWVRSWPASRTWYWATFYYSSLTAHVIAGCSETFQEKKCPWKKNKRNLI